MDERFYIEMEAARNKVATAYFAPRPHLDNQANRDMFDVGFDRGFRELWNLTAIAGEVNAKT